VEMLFRSNIFALVGGGDRPKFATNKVILWDDQQQQPIGELSFRTQVKNVKMRLEKICVVLDSKIYVYNFEDLTLVEAIDTCPNPRGLIALNPDTANQVLACPSKDIGHATIKNYRLSNFILNTNCAAHDLSAMALTNDGRMLATSSQEGTLIRVRKTTDGQLLGEFRRGANSCIMYQITFDIQSKWIACTSDKSTIHVFTITN